MNELINPTDVARETLKQLAARRIAPTPDHYEAIYHSIAGTPDEQRLHPLIQTLERKLNRLPRQSPELLRTMELFRHATRSGHWERIPDIVFKCVDLQGGQTELTRSWADLIRDFMRQWELRNPAYPITRKQEALEKVLINFGADPVTLNEKLDALTRSWTETASGGNEHAEELLLPVPAPAQAAATTAATTPSATTIKLPDIPCWSEWRELVGQVLEWGLAARLAHYPDLAIDVTGLAREARNIHDENDLRKFIPRLKKFWMRLALVNKHEERLCDSLLNLLHLFTNNIGEIIIEEEWVHGQVAVLQDIMARPLDMRMLSDAETGLKEVIYKQSMIKHNLQEAQTSLKSVLASFIDRLGTIAQSTDQYNAQIGQYSEQLERSNNIVDIKNVLDNLMRDTRAMRLDTVRVRDELLAARTQAESAKNRVQQLESELRVVSEKVREDQLTGALNRHGLEENIAAEAMRARHNGKPLVLVLFDLDDFKRLNDTRGRSAGDKALIHMVSVVKSLLRPSDQIARYGGEEFVLLLPSTTLSQAGSVIVRLQRELTKHFFLHNNEKILLTFSAGITLLQLGEPSEQAIDRASAAMNRAKQSGKNQVEIVDPPPPTLSDQIASIPHL